MNASQSAFHVPAALAERPHWIVWRTIRRKGKATKLPFSPLNRGLCSTTEPRSWGTLRQAQTALETREFAGLGFCFRRGDGVFGVDLDSCFSGLFPLNLFAERVIQLFDTYAEISPSGQGVKLFALGEHDRTGCVQTFEGETPGGKRKAIEIYGWGRFFAFTGNRLENSPYELADCRTQLAALLKAMDPPRISTRPATTRPPSSAAERSLIERGRLYLAKVPPAVSGSGGHNRTFRAACVLVREIGLSAADAYALLSEWNDRCDPPWSEHELRHKVADACKPK